MVRLQLRARHRGEVRQLAQRDIHAERAGPIAIAFDALRGVVVQLLALDQLGVQQLRIEVADNGGRAQFAAIGQNHANGFFVFDDEFGHVGIGVDGDAARLAFLAHGLGDRAHAADRVAPHAGLAVHLAEQVVQQHVGAARRVRAGEIADHRIPAQYGLQRLAFEIVIQQFAGGLGEQVEQVATAAQVEVLQALRDRIRAQPVGEGDAFADVGRREVDEFLQHRHHAVEHRGVIGQARDIARCELRDLAVGVSAAEAEAAAIRQRQEIRVRPLHYPQAVLRQAQVGDHLRVEQADRVAGHRIAEAGMEFLGHRRATDEVPALEHAHLQAGGREIGRADQAVVSATDDQDIGVRSCRHETLQGRQHSRPWRPLPTSGAPPVRR